MPRKRDKAGKNSPGSDEKAVAIFGDELEVIHNTLVAQKFQYIFGTCKADREGEKYSELMKNKYIKSERGRERERAAWLIRQLDSVKGDKKRRAKELQNGVTMQQQQQLRRRGRGRPFVCAVPLCKWRTPDSVGSGSGSETARQAAMQQLSSRSGFLFRFLLILFQINIWEIAASSSGTELPNLTCVL